MHVGLCKKYRAVEKAWLLECVEVAVSVSHGVIHGGLYVAHCGYR